MRLAARVIAIAVGVLALWIALAWVLDRYGRGPEPSGSFDAIIVAGARVRGDGRPMGSMQRRSERGIELWKAGRAPLLVFTGGTRAGGRVPSEASVGARLAREAGVPESALRLESRSRSTAENARFARELIEAERVLVVSDTYHVFRCERLFGRQFREVSVVGVAPGWYPQLRLAMREVLAVGWLFVSSPFQ